MLCILRNQFLEYIILVYNTLRKDTGVVATHCSGKRCASSVVAASVQCTFSEATCRRDVSQRFVAYSMSRP